MSILITILAIATLSLLFFIYRLKKRMDDLDFTLHLHLSNDSGKERQNKLDDLNTSKDILKIQTEHLELLSELMRKVIGT